MEKVIRDGLVAMQHYSSNPWDVEIKGEGITYNFRPSHNVSIAMVKEEHVGKLLSITRKACCGTNPQRFTLASLINYNLWKYGDRHGPIAEELK